MAEEAVAAAPDHEVPMVVSVLSTLLERLSEHNDAAAASCGLLPSTTSSSAAAVGPAAPLYERAASAFHGLTKPSISVRSYLERIFRYANCSVSCYVVAYIYLDRFVQRHHHALAVDSFNVHRLLITSVLSAVKFMDDIYYNNAYFAKVGGISLVEMNYLEVVFLFGVGFELNISPAVFNSYCSILQREVYLESPPPAPPRLQCYLSEEESGSCQQTQQLAV